MKDAIREIYRNRNDFIMIGLTGRMGSGCSELSSFLSQNSDKHALAPVSVTDFSDDETRKKAIVYKHYKQNWHPFTVINTEDVITSFILESDFETFNNYLKDNGFIPLDETYKETFNEQHLLSTSIIKTDIHAIYLDEELNRAYDYIFATLPDFSKNMRSELSQKSFKNFNEVYRELGRHLRKNGSILSCNSESAEYIYTIANRINSFMGIIKRYNAIRKKRTYIVIDAIRNPFEVLFFRERYSSFYLFAINAEKEYIYNKLHTLISVSKEEIDELHANENPYYLVDSYESFISQNIQACIQKADIHLFNDEEKTDFFNQAIKYVSLIKHPGLVNPSRDEVMMQIAFTSKLNSACLSRQVGAAVTNAEGALKAIGWNSAAEGQTPCLLRSRNELLKGTASNAYSAYEKTPAFKSSLIKFAPSISEVNGLNDSFCFKTVYTESKEDERGNQVHTRSLHAEENAFLSIAKYGGEGIKGGTLYTTASPCDLCSKKAYQLGIERVVFVDPYPGIAREQILNTGMHPPKVDAFEGAIGLAYHKLYEQMLSYKDELYALRD